MNRTQAKARFTELTGLPATQGNLYEAIWASGGYVADLYKLGNKYIDRYPRFYDSRTTDCWVVAVVYIDTLKEVA